MVKEMAEAAFVPWDALSCLALTLKLCRPIVPSADCTTSVAGVYLAKRRTANHPCPVCGKHYVNEGSLRKHLACHPETSQLSTSLRMWPCSVCQAVFTHESGKYLSRKENAVRLKVPRDVGRVLVSVDVMSYHRVTFFTYIHMYIYVHTYTHTHTHIYIYIYIIYIYIHVHTHISLIVR